MSVSLFGRLCRSIRGGAALLLLLGMLLLVCGLSLGTLTVLAWDQPIASPSPQVLLVLDPELRDDEINDLYLEIREWREIRSLVYARDLGHLTLPNTPSVPTSGRGMLLRMTSYDDLAAVEARTRPLPGVRQVVPLAPPERIALPQASVLKPILASAFAVTLLGSFLAISGGIQRLIWQWHGELELLRLSGISRKNMVSSFAAIGVLIAGIGAALAVLVLYLGFVWAQSQVEFVQQILPQALESERMIGLTIAAIIAGLFVGVLAGAWGARTRNLR